LLEPAFRTVRDLRKLADTLEVRLETLDDSSRRVVALREIATIETHLGRADEALAARGRAWLEDVGNTETLVELESLAAKMNAFDRLVGYLDKGGELTMEPDLRGDLCAFKANILDARLASPEKAIDAWRESLAARPDHQDAFVALERLLGDAGRTAELCETLEKHAEVVVEAEQREGLIKRMASLFEAPLGDLPKSIAAWRAVLDIDAEDVQALDALARLYAATSEWQALVDVLQQKIACTKDVLLVRALRFQAAELLDEKLEQASDAAEQLRRILEVHPDDSDALDMLAGIFVREQQHGELVEVLDRRSALAKSPAERDKLTFQAAQVTEKELLDIPGAIERYRRILELNVGHVESRDALWGLCRGEDHRLLAIEVLEPLLRLGQEWKPLCEILELRLGAVDAPAERIEILADIAQVEEAALGQSAAAFATWARALAEDPARDDVRSSLERLAQENKNLAGLAEVYEERLKSVYDSELQRWFGSKLADLYEHALSKPERAVELWREIETLPGAEGTALARQEVLLRALGKNDDLAEVLTREAEVATDPAVQADFWASLGELRLGAMDDRDGAIAAFRSAIERVPRHGRSTEALRGLAFGKAPPVDALDILEPLAEDHGDFAELVALIEARLTVTDDNSDKASLLSRIGDLLETRIKDLPRAIDALGRALVAEPGASHVMDRLERIAGLAGTPAEAAVRLEAILDAVEPMLFADTALRAARMRLVAGGPSNEDAALDLYVRVLETDPENATALESLDALYRQRGDGRKLADIIERRGALELDPTRRLAFYAEAASLHESNGDLAAAISAWRLGREGDETNVHALDELARLHAAAGQREEQVEMLREKVRLLDDGKQRVDVLMEIVAILSGPLADLEGATDAIKEALDSDPNDTRALSALVDLEEKRGDFAALEEALLRQSAAVTGNEQVAVLAKLAHNASEKLNDGERALVYLQQILAIDAQNQLAFDETERLLTALERWHELIEMYEKRADVEAQAGNKSTELAYRVKVAAIWGERLGAEDSALEALQAVLEREPRHFASLLAVARIHEGKEAWREAAAALEKAGEAASTAQDKAEVFCRRAVILAAIGGKADDVATLYKVALGHVPTWLPAIVALEGLARKTGDNAQLVKHLLARSDVDKDEAKQKAILSEVATLYMGPLASPADAVAPLEKLARLSPTDLAVQENLGRALIASGRTEEGEFAFGQLIEQLGKARRQKDVARLQWQLGTYAEARGDLALGKQRYMAAYQIDPTQAGVLGALSRLALRQGDAEAARRFLRTLLLQSFDEKAAGITKAEVYLALGNLHREAGENPKARNMFERGLEVDPKNEALKQALAATPK
jgi:tetratricopeptide (TPR) repeat protein